MKLSTILDQIDLGGIALPEFQRSYVWNRDQVRALMDSLYRKYPVGSLLVWATKTETAKARGDGSLASGVVKLLLDGQQRVTTLYGIIHGRPPKFFDGNARAFMGLYFNLDEEAFEFYAPLKMNDNSRWINVADVMKAGPGETIKRLVQIADLQENLPAYINRLAAIDAIKQVDLHIEEIAGEDKTVDVVVEIFNRVNSGGTKLSKGDLALAKVCAAWPEARHEMTVRLQKRGKAGFWFRLELLLRCVNTILTGEALFTALESVKPADFREGLTRAEEMIDKAINMIASRLGLDHDRVFGSRGSLPLIARYLAQRNGHLEDHRERDKLLYWYAQTILWGRYAGSIESVLNQDLAAIESQEGALDRLIALPNQNRGNLWLQSTDFGGWSKGARFYPLLYMMTRVCHARDWCSGDELSNHLLGHMNRLEVHHIFPKAMLKKHSYPRPERNAIANFTFLTKECNGYISDREPFDYLTEFAKKNPEALRSHWLPLEPELWEPKNYPEFLAARRELLAKAANNFLDGLLKGAVPEPKGIGSITYRGMAAIADEEDDDVLRECGEW
ncbi:MAG: GmrSD restriction endonuclease domain-containing protein, partial [Terriglobia bacterium]